MPPRTPTPHTLFTSDIIRRLAAGAALFGSGGAGDPTLGSLIADAVVERLGPPALTTLEALPLDGLLLPVAAVGSPTVMNEKHFDMSCVHRLREAAEAAFDAPAVAAVIVELGGLNGVLPVGMAAELGLPLLDADMIGRGFPNVAFTKPNLLGLPLGRTFVSDERGTVITIDSDDADNVNDLLRAVTTVFGGLGMICWWPMPVAGAGEALILGSVSAAIVVGERLSRRPFDADSLADAVGGTHLLSGRVAHIQRELQEGVPIGSLIVEGGGDARPRLLRVEFRDENVLAMEDGVIRAVVPDIISVIDADEAWPLVTEDIEVGQRVAVVALPCDAVWTTPAGLELVGPRTFGLEVDHVPVGGG